MIDTKSLEKITIQTRRDILRMVHRVNSGHPGGSLGCAEFLVTLFNSEMKRNNDFSMDGKDEDIFFLSNGHISPVFYSVLARCGYFEVNELNTFRLINSRLQGHPTTHEGLPGVRIASGSLGQGLSVAIGAALSKKLNYDENLVYCLMGDGELQEGQTWEAILSASSWKVDNLCLVVDYNNMQVEGSVEQVMSLEPLIDKFLSFGWNTISCNGNKITELLDSFNKARKCSNRLSVIIAKTLVGKGVDFLEGQLSHNLTFPQEIARKALISLQNYYE